MPHGFVILESQRPCTRECTKRDAKKQSRLGNNGAFAPGPRCRRDDVSHPEIGQAVGPSAVSRERFHPASLSRAGRTSDHFRPVRSKPPRSFSSRGIRAINLTTRLPRELHFRVPKKSWPALGIAPCEFHLGLHIRHL